jgi:hypothetical protein
MEQSRDLEGSNDTLQVGVTTVVRLLTYLCKDGILVPKQASAYNQTWVKAIDRNALCAIFLEEASL